MNYDIISDPNAEKYQFFYPDAERIIDSMKQMIKELKAKRQRKRAQKEKKVELTGDVNESVYQEEDLWTVSMNLWSVVCLSKHGFIMS